MRPHFADRLAAAIEQRRSPAVVGIDPLADRLPRELRPRAATLPSAVAAIEGFCGAVLEAVADYVPAVKINAGFFEAYYGAGLTAYFRLVARAHECGLLVIGDIKRGDIGSTAAVYARGHLADPAYADVDPAQVADAVTLAGYLGANAVRPFIDAARETGRGVYVLVRPSDPGADEIHDFGGDMPFYRHLGQFVDRWGSAPELRGACGLSCVGAVVAPKDPASTESLRALLPHTPFLVPGYGAQGATAESCRPCFLAQAGSAVVNASRSVIFAYENPRYASTYGDDWRACIAAACRDFAADVARIAPSCTG